MSKFVYFCEKCEQGYEEERKIGTESPKKCPNCGTKYGKGFFQDMSGQTVHSYLSPTTFGQQSDLNKKRASKYLMEEKEAEARAICPSVQDQKAFRDAGKELDKFIKENTQ